MNAEQKGMPSFSGPDHADSGALRPHLDRAGHRLTSGLQGDVVGSRRDPPGALALGKRHRTRAGRREPRVGIVGYCQVEAVTGTMAR